MYIISIGGGLALDNPAICDIIDIETYKMEILDPLADNPDTLLDDTKHAVEMDVSPTKVQAPDSKVEYAIGYVGSWPPDPNVVPGKKVAEECNATSITWYPDFVQAQAAADAAGTGVTKVRVSASSVDTGQYITGRIKVRARENFLSTGQPIPNNTLLVNYVTAKSIASKNRYISNYFVPKTYDVVQSGSNYGDRITLQKAKARIRKIMSPVFVSPGDETNITLKPSFTTDFGTQEVSDVLQIVDVLPKGLFYKVGSAMGGYSNNATPYGEPTVISATDSDCNTYAAAIVAEGYPCGTLNGGTGDETILLWDLGTQTTGTVYGDLGFTAIVAVDAPSGVLQNYAQIESPADDSIPSRRIDNANVTNSVPTSLLILKKAITPIHEINQGALENWMQFQVGLRNGSDHNLTDLDIIDLLPFNGDGAMGSFVYTAAPGGTAVDRSRSPGTNYNGTFVFDSMNFDDNGVCDATGIEYWFTSYTGVIDISPASDTNNIPSGSTPWCQGTATGPDASCGYANTDVTAARIRGVDMSESAICFLNLSFATTGNLDENIYSNTAGAKAIGVTNAVLSNTVQAKVYASSIGDKVWYDKNHNGIQDDNSSEPGLEGVTVNLYNGAGTLIATTITDSDGAYNFPNLIHGDYVVEVSTPVGYFATDKNAGGDTALDSDIDAGTNKTDTIALGEDENNIDIDAGFYTPIISGHVFSDGDGDANVNGSPLSTPDGVQLYATLLDASGNVLAATSVTADGTYIFNREDGVRTSTDYKVLISTEANATTSTLPANWNSTGEKENNTGTGKDTPVNGIAEVHVGTENAVNNDFGINKKPVANTLNVPSQLNPGGDTKITVPALPVTDNEDGTPTTITIKTLPDPSTGVLYYDGVPVTQGQVITDFDPSKLTVDPTDGDQTVEFTYTITDAAGVESDVATVDMTFTGLSISGNVLDDGNGDGNIGGDSMNQIDDTPLYATLLDAEGNVITTTPVAADGTYSFTGADGVTANTTYSVVLSTEANSSNPTLPAGWNNADGEKAGNDGTNGNDGQTNGAGDGKVTITVGTENAVNNDFGINKKPVANTLNVPSQLNPGGDTKITVSALPVTDNEDGTPTTITIKTLPDPSAGVLYYDGVPVTQGQVITDFDPSKLTVDPTDGDQTVEFTYSTTDAAGMESDVATVSMEFAGLGISGTLLSDGDGDANVNGNPMQIPEGTTIYVNLVDADGNVVATKPVDADGNYQFLGEDGVTANTTYTLVLSTTEGVVGAPAPEPELPDTWSNSGENINSAGTGNDGAAQGVITVALGAGAVTEVVFGINGVPIAEDITVDIQSNPSGDTQYQVPILPVTDNEDGTPTTITIKTLPDPSTGVLYYDGAAVTEGQVIPDFDPALLVVDPINGNPTMVFTYTATDAAGIESSPATVTVPFLGDMHLGDKVWTDANDNGIQDEGEEGVSGVSVQLYTADGTLTASTETNATGEYEFTIEIPGEYYLVFEDSYYYTTKGAGDDASKDSDIGTDNPRTDTFVLEYGDTNMEHDAGMAPVMHIGDYVWVDANKNGMQDKNEEPVQGAIVELFDAEGNPVEDVHGNHRIKTDADGKYGFDIMPGEYQIHFILPGSKYDGYVFSTKDQGDDSKDTDVDNQGRVTVAAVAGKKDLSLDVGINCGCEEGMRSNGGDALSTLGLLSMLLVVLGSGLLFMRNEEFNR